MALKKYKLGELIKKSTTNNKDLIYGTDMIVGVNTNGVFAEPKGENIDINLKPYKIVNDGAFVYNPTRINLGSLAYRTEGLCIVSHLYIVFYLNEEGEKVLDPMYLYMYFHRNEFLREVEFRNFGSQRPEFSFSDMADIDICIPPIDQQRKFVNVYLSLQANLEAYQSKTDDLKLVCDGYMDQIKATIKKVKIGELLTEVDCRNVDLAIQSISGINIDKIFMESVADANGLDLKKYKVVHKNDFAFSGMQTGRDESIRIALNSDAIPKIVSPAYTVFKVSTDKVLEQYIMLWFSRKEIDRYGWFASDGSIRSNLDIERFNEIEIPLPNVDIQKSIVDIFSCYIERKRIAAKLKQTLNDLCPILIRGSLQTAN